MVNDIQSCWFCAPIILCSECLEQPLQSFCTGLRPATHIVCVADWLHVTHVPLLHFRQPVRLTGASLQELSRHKRLRPEGWGCQLGQLQETRFYKSSLRQTWCLGSICIALHCPCFVVASPAAGIFLTHIYFRGWTSELPSELTVSW